MERQEKGSNFYMLTAQILNDKNLNHAEKLTMAILNGLADEEGKCYPGNEWLSEKLDLKETAIKDILKNLEKFNYIKRETISCVNNPFKKYRIIYVCNNFKLSLPGAENRPIEGAENRPTVGRKTAYIIDKKELIDKKNIKKPSASPPPSPEAQVLCAFFFEKIRERNPEFKEPNLEKWAREMDCLLRLDKRDIERVKTLILWASEHKWWKTACLSPSKLRKDFDAMSMQMSGDTEKVGARNNRLFAINMKEKYPEQMKDLSFDDKYAMNRKTGKEVPFSLPEETFKDALFALFGGTYVRRG